MNRFTLTLMGVGLAVLQAFLLPSLLAQTQVTPKPPAAAIIITNAPPGAENGKPRGATPYLSSGVSDIIRMFQAGVEEPVILAFIQSSTVAYHPSAREVIYLRELGLPQSLITGMLKRGGDLRDRASEADREERNRAAQQQQLAPPVQAPANPAPSASASPAPVLAYPATAYVAASYVAPYVSYPSYNYAAYSYYPGYTYASYGACRPSYYGNYYGNCYRGYGAYGAYGGYGYYGGGSRYCGSSVGVGFGSCGSRVSVGFGGGYRGYGYGYGHGGIRYTGGGGGYAYCR